MSGCVGVGGWGRWVVVLWELRRGRGGMGSLFYSMESRGEFVERGVWRGNSGQLLSCLKD